VSRFKEQRRIDQAIEHKNSSELEWALGYAEKRLDISSMKHHDKHWLKIKKKITQAIEETQ